MHAISSAAPCHVHIPDPDEPWERDGIRPVVAWAVNESGYPIAVVIGSNGLPLCYGFGSELSDHGWRLCSDPSC